LKLKASGGRVAWFLQVSRLSQKKVNRGGMFLLQDF
jgi:hypothetical protein